MLGCERLTVLEKTQLYVWLQFIQYLVFIVSLNSVIVIL